MSRGHCIECIPAIHCVHLIHASISYKNWFNEFVDLITWLIMVLLDRFHFALIYHAIHLLHPNSVREQFEKMIRDAQDKQATDDGHGLWRICSGYFSEIKLLFIIVAFVLWLRSMILKSFLLEFGLFYFDAHLQH
jgi:hypothetical protein